MNKIWGKLTYANVVASLALFVALGGAGYAAVKLPKNSVGTRQIKKGAVTGAKLGKGAVQASNLAPGAVTPTAIDPKTLGTVPSATNAGHATSADTAGHATSADSATRAANAETAATLGGQTAAQIAAASKLSCPPNTILAGGLCFEKSRRTATDYFTAFRACTADGLLLPTIAQQAVFMGENSGLFQPTDTEWAGQAWLNGSTFEASQVFPNGSYQASPFVNKDYYRCGSPPSN